MPDTTPIAFLSYVHSDDRHDLGKITALRERLEGEVGMLLGKRFQIFQDRNDILWGQRWQERIVDSLLSVTFLIPILTPSFFNSPACRFEFQTFHSKEKLLGVNGLILPLYYVQCDQLDGDPLPEKDEMADLLKSRQWVDWRPFRHKDFADPAVAQLLSEVASQLKATMRKLERELLAEYESRATAAPELTLPERELQTKDDLNLRLPKKRRKKRTADDLSVVPSELILPSEPYTLAVPEVRNGTRGLLSATEFTSKPYYAYTREFDEIVHAQELASIEELGRLQHFIAKALASSEIALPKAARVKRPTAVTMLIDNSGSMRGAPIMRLACLVIKLMEWLESRGVIIEVLGYTTRAWKGGQSREEWLGAGRPPQPGRLNDLRHIIYKDFETEAREAQLYCSLLLREGLLKENIDGEALLWAIERLVKKRTHRRILLMFSDGAPVDDSTLSVNRSSFLFDHLKFVANHFSAKDEIALYGVGMGHDVSSLFSKSVSWLKADWDVRQLASLIEPDLE